MLLDVELSQDEAAAILAALRTVRRLFLEQPAPSAPIIAGMRACAVWRAAELASGTQELERAARLAWGLDSDSDSPAGPLAGLAAL